MGRPKSTPESFWRKVDRRGPDDCWLWKASRRNGYGHHCINRVTYYAHRYAYELANGKPPSGRAMQVMHSCNNKRCCNPNHLSLGTAAENTQSAYRDGLINLSRKYSDDFIQSIFRDPRPQVELEKVYGISQGYISSIKLGRQR